MALFLSCANGSHRPTSSYANGLVCCDVCGKVLHEDLYTDEPSFVKGAGGESKLSGSVVRSIQSGYSESFRRTLDKGLNTPHQGQDISEEEPHSGVHVLHMITPSSFHCYLC